MSKPIYIRHPFGGTVIAVFDPDSASENPLTQDERWLIDFDRALTAERKLLAEARRERDAERERCIAEVQSNMVPTWFSEDCKAAWSRGTRETIARINAASGGEEA